MTVFVSYSRDYDRVGALVVALRRHGLRPWRDQLSLRPGDRTEREIAHELERCDAAMLWIGGNTMNSDFVHRIEIPLIFENHHRRGMRIVPIFVDLSAEAGIEAIRAATGQEIGGHNGHVFHGPDHLDSDLAAAASAEVHAHLQARASAHGGRRPIVRCVTRSDSAGARDEADLNMDWIPEYPASGALPDDTTVQLLAHALHRGAQHLLSTFGAGPVEMHLKCHLHIGIALGFELRRVTGAIPHIAVENDWWTCEVVPQPADEHRLEEHVNDGAPSATRSAVEISLSRDVSRAVSQHITDTGTHYRKRIKLEPLDGPGQLAVTPTTLNPWAEQAADAIRRTRQHPGIQAVDIFIAAPIGFAVALGWRLNAVGGVNLFHLEGNTGPYRHVWTLPDS